MPTASTLPTSKCRALHYRRFTVRRPDGHRTVLIVFAAWHYGDEMHNAQREHERLTREAHAAHTAAGRALAEAQRLLRAVVGRPLGSAVTAYRRCDPSRMSDAGSSMPPAQSCADRRLGRGDLAARASDPHRPPRALLR
jgi:hypothetical protein